MINLYLLMNIKFFHLKLRKNYIFINYFILNIKFTIDCYCNKLKFDK